MKTYEAQVYEAVHHGLQQDPVHPRQERANRETLA